MKSSTKFFIGAIITAVMAIMVAYMGALLHDLKTPPFKETGEVSYIISICLGFLTFVMAMIGGSALEERK